VFNLAMLRRRFALQPNRASKQKFSATTEDFDWKFFLGDDAGERRYL
jgi:hypothetical protein